MTKTQIKRISLASALFALVIGGAAVAGAKPTGSSGPEAREQCSGEGKGATTPAERFQKSDTNGDGFLTKDEVGEKRWERLKVADTNADGKVSKAEIEQAHKDGKLGRHGRGTDAKGPRS